MASDFLQQHASVTDSTHGVSADFDTTTNLWFFAHFVFGQVGL
jgi:hypothetical protein